MTLSNPIEGKGGGPLLSVRLRDGKGLNHPAIQRAPVETTKLLSMLHWV